MKVPISDTETIYIDGILKTNLDIYKALPDQELDVPFVIDGREGTGKTTIGQQILKYFNNDFSLDDVIFRGEQWVDEVVKSPYKRAIMLDESFEALYSSDALSKISKIITKMMMEIRTKGLYMAFILPSYFDLSKNIAIRRSLFLIHTYFVEGYKRGQFLFYGHDRKLRLFQNKEAKQYYNYAMVKSNFYGRFTKPWILDKRKYDLKKQEAFKGYAERLGESPKKEVKKVVKHKWLRQRDALIYNLVERGKKPREIIKIISKYTNDVPEITRMQQIARELGQNEEM